MPPPLNNKQLKKVLSCHGRLSYNKTASHCSVGRTTVFNYWKVFFNKLFKSAKKIFLEILFKMSCAISHCS